MALRRTVKTLICFLLFLVSAGFLAYGWMALQFDYAQKALERGDADQAMGHYARVESAFDQVPGLPELLQREYGHLSFHQVSILYRQMRDEEALAKLEQLPGHAPDLASRSEYSYWMGNLLFRQAAQSGDPETTVNLLKTALSEYQRGLSVEPDNWDLKFNYELVRSIFSQQDRDRKAQAQKVKSIMDKMRPKEPSLHGLAPEKRG
jgi:tetratricopeptide (TPR) repeat protein